MKICKHSLSHRHSFIVVSMNLRPNTSLFIVLLMCLNSVRESPSVWHLYPFDLIHHYLSTLLFSGTVRYYRLILYFPSSRISHYFRELFLPFLKMVQRSKDLDIRCAHCYWMLLFQVHSMEFVCPHIYTDVNQNTVTPVVISIFICTFRRL